MQVHFLFPGILRQGQGILIFRLKQYFITHGSDNSPPVKGPNEVK
jgi:hypothetical protein